MVAALYTHSFEVPVPTVLFIIRWSVRSLWRQSLLAELSFSYRQ